MLKFNKPKFLMTLNEKFLESQTASLINFKIIKPITLNYIDEAGMTQVVKVAQSNGGVVSVKRLGDGDRLVGTVKVPVGALVNEIKEDGSLDKTVEVAEEHTLEAFLAVNEMLTLVRSGAVEIVKLA